MSKSRKKTKQLTNKKKRLIIINVFLAVFLFLGIGYAALSANLNIFGDVTVKKYLEPEVANTLRRFVGGARPLVEEYSGEEEIKDSPSGEGDEPILYWHADNDTEADEIQDKWNVIFGGFCWQTIRTTATGGTKMIYNGVPINGTCSASTKSIGTSKFNDSVNTPASVGYMYNKSYHARTLSNSFKMETTTLTIDTSYYYSDSIGYDNSQGEYYLINPSQISGVADYNELIGKYMLPSGDNTSDTKALYIKTIYSNPSRVAGVELKNGNTNAKIYVADTYIDNGNGTYTLENPVEFSYANFSCPANSDKYICDGAITCTDLKHIIYTSIYDACRYFSAEEHLYKYSENVSYSNGQYTLTGDIITVWDIDKNLNALSTHHYTCSNTSTNCSTVSYINYYSRSNNYYTQTNYVDLSNVANMETAVNEMLLSDDVNNTNSTIKTYIENWFANNLLGYEDYLEDTIFCNDRSIKNLGGFNPSGGSLTAPLSIGNSGMGCSNITDQFSVSNPKAPLTYPVGLMTVAEMSLINNNNLKKGSDSWLMKPIGFTANYADVSIIRGYNGSFAGIDNDGRSSGHKVTNTIGVRPAISLKPGIEYTSGDGSRTNPYIVGIKD